MRAGIATILMLLTALPCLAQIKIPEACGRVAAAYGMPAPSRLTRDVIKVALAGLKKADQNNPDVRLCQDLLKMEISK